MKQGRRRNCGGKAGRGIENLHRRLNRVLDRPGYVTRYSRALKGPKLHEGLPFCRKADRRLFTGQAL